jgi:single-stranded-DNA-specific exonuclease
MSSELSLTGRIWELSEQAPALDSVHPLTARCIPSRLNGASLSDWLKPSIKHLHDPALMLGMDRATARIRAAIDDRQRVRIVTDYDVDGTTSSLILQQTLLRVGGKGLLDYHIPNRFVEGYGFSVTAAEKAAADGIGVIITADIGVKDHDAVNAAAAAGVDVIICDHHLPGGASVPERAYAVLCPPQDGCSYPNKALAACGVSLKLAQAMLVDHPNADALIRSMMKVAAIGTVADVVDLSGLENRAIVSLGVEQLRLGRHSPGLQALLEVAGLSPDAIDAGALGYKIGPRINAAGRLEGASAVVELFSERDPGRAHARARALDQLNERRKVIQGELVEACLDQLGDSLPDFAVLWGDESAGWHRGVVGIVAARVRDQINRPVAVIAVTGDSARGSVRSTPRIHAVNALSSASDLLPRFGGHPAAAGFSIDTKNLPALREQLDAFAAAQL